MAKQVSVADGNVNDLDWNSSPPGSNTDTLITVDMTKSATFSFTTPAGSSTAIGQIAAAEQGGGPLDRKMTVSDDERGNHVLPFGEREATAPTLPFTVGHPLGGMLALQPSTKYYVHVENLQLRGGNTNIRIDIKKPGSPQPI